MSISAGIVVSANDARIETCTPHLRFVERDGRRILQQAWSWTSASRTTGGHGWRDVPMVAE